MTVEERFAQARPRLLRLAYSELGDVGEAEDVVQEASARARRETYVGPWLPEPVLSSEEDPVDRVTLDESSGGAVVRRQPGSHHAY
jgi:RNA polymerase sigma-70 factor (ECF subfamily)